MLLKKIELNGFKSFADKTTLAILPGITSIVGPNGCGKTNIVDAVSWVLGEQRISLLRGQKMEDVIFNGTSGRPPVSMAEVTLTFDNSDGLLPLDFSEVSVTRRVFRSGESEYMINKKTCLLRDIRELIMGTGLGNRAYSQVGQGRINQILQSRPEERRSLLEEAARISRYRKKKEEAERKLEHTATNLLRVEDIIKEVKRQLSIAQRQARQAERYRKYRDELRETEINLSLFQLDDIRSRGRNLGNERQQWREKFEELEREVEKVEDELSELRKETREKEEALSALRASRIGKQGEIDRSSHRIELNEERLRELEKEGDRVEGEIRSITDSIAAGEEEYRRLQSAWEELKTANQEKSEELGRRESDLKKSREQLGRAEETLNTYRSRVLESSREETRLRNEYMGLKAGNKELLLRKRKLEVEGEKLADEIEESRVLIEETEPIVREASNRIAELKSRLEAVKDQAGDYQAALEDLETRREESLISQTDLDSRIALFEGEKSPGSPAPARELKELIERGEEKLKGAVGFVNEFLKIEPGAESLVYSALDGKENLLVVDTFSAALNVLGFLRDNGWGPVGLIILDILKASRNESGGGSFRKYVSCLGPLKGMEKGIFGNPVMVNRIEDLTVPPESASGEILIAPPGAALFPGGIIVWAGCREEDEENDIQSLRQRRREAVAEREEIDAGIKRIKEEWARQRDQLEEIGRNLHREEMASALKENDLVRGRRELERLELSREAIEAELGELAEEEKNNFGRMKQLELELDGSPSPEQIAEKEITRVAVEVEETAKAVRSQEADVTELKITLASSREREDGLDRRRRRLKEETENLRESLQDCRQRIDEGEKRKNELIRQSEESRRLIDSLKEEISGMDDRIAVLEKEISECNGRCRVKEDTYRNVRPRFQEVQARLSSHEVRLAEWRLKEQGITQRMREKYRVELDELERPGEEIDPGEMEIKIGKLQKKMERMSNVNLGALEDRENYEERLQLLTEQKADLEAASRDIEEAISRINVTARQKLQETYDTVRDNFRRIFADLFDGGKADLVLEEGKDILESGLEIVAQPPGKKLSNINLLSGGEKALTTIALVFSLFKVQPSPFYVLDEIDAPLDEANISRFVKLLKSLSDDSQFIIITHNKRSISEADILYGITMEETGISKVVSVRLAGAELEKEIKELV